MGHHHHRQMRMLFLSTDCDREYMRSRQERLTTRARCKLHRMHDVCWRVSRYRVPVNMWECCCRIRNTNTSSPVDLLLPRTALVNTHAQESQTNGDACSRGCMVGIPLQQSKAAQQGSSVGQKGCCCQRHDTRMFLGMILVVSYHHTKGFRKQEKPLRTTTAVAKSQSRIQSPVTDLSDD